MSRKQVPPLAQDWRDHPLIVAARAHPDERTKRFLVAIARVAPHLTADEMDKVELILQSALGRIGIAELRAML